MKYKIKFIVKDAKEVLPDVDYKAATTCKCIRQKVPNDRDTPEVYLNHKWMSEIYKEIAEIFFSKSCAI